MKNSTTRTENIGEGRAPVRPNRRKGSVLMEYILVQVLVACLLMLIMNELFYNWITASFGPGGIAVKYFFQRLLGGLSLPIP